MQLFHLVKKSIFSAIAKSNPEIKGRNSILFRHDALQVSGHALFTSTPHVFLPNIFINTTERSIHFY
jgi:hypothetical protein